MKRKIVVYYFTLLIIILSKSLVFGIKYSQAMNLIFFASAAILLILNIRNTHYNLKKIYIIVLMIIINILINNSSGIDYSQVLFLIILLISMCVVQANLYKSEFEIAFINIITILAAISLICIVLSQYIPINKFPFYSEEYIKGNYFGYTFYNTFLANGEINRNSGIFWEPGAFQIFLNLALMCMIFNDRKTNKLYKLKMIILIIATVTTESTTGYIVIGIILVYSLLTRKIQIFKNKSILTAMISTLLGIIITVITVYFISNSYVVINKINNRNQGTSYSIRQNDMYSTIDIIKKYPIMGAGFASDLITFEENTRGITSNSNGLLNFVEKFGIPISFIYLYIIFIGIRKFYDNSNIIDCIIIFAIYITLNATELVILLPVFLIYLFDWKSKKIV